MAGKYKYQGLTKDGRKVEGAISANSLRTAKNDLRKQGIRVTKIAKPRLLDADLGTILIEKGLAKPFGLTELNRFTKQLAILINAGVPIMESLEILGQQEKNPSLKLSIVKIVELVGNGMSLNEAISQQKGFTKLYSSLVKAGEAAGILDTVLDKLVEFMEKQAAITKKVKKAMTYPSIVFFLGMGITYGLMVFVVPIFVDMLKEGGQEVPDVTKFVIAISNFLQEYTIIMVPAAITGYFLFSNYIKTRDGKIKWDRFTMKAPLFGNIIIKGGLAGLFRTLATMLSAGVPLIDSLDICIDTIDNTQMAKDMTMVKVAVTRGKSITEPLSRIKYFPPLVNQMVKVGESTGNLDEMLIKVADVFEEETGDAIDVLTTMIEPIILVVLGGIIGTVLIAMYLPIFMSAGGA